jgi:hypothetical protein
MFVMEQAQQTLPAYAAAAFFSSRPAFCGKALIGDGWQDGHGRLSAGIFRGMGGPFRQQERGTDALVAPVLRPLFYNSFLFYYLYPYHSGPIARA